MSPCGSRRVRSLIGTFMFQIRCVNYGDFFGESLFIYCVLFTVYINTFGIFSSILCFSLSKILISFKLNSLGFSLMCFVIKLVMIFIDGFCNYVLIFVFNIIIVVVLVFFDS